MAPARRMGMPEVFCGLVPLCIAFKQHEAGGTTAGKPRANGTRQVGQCSQYRADLRSDGDGRRFKIVAASKDFL